MIMCNAAMYHARRRRAPSAPQLVTVEHGDRSTGWISQAVARQFPHAWACVFGLVVVLAIEEGHPAMRTRRPTSMRWSVVADQSSPRRRLDRAAAA